MFVQSEVMRKGPARFDMCGQFKGYPLSVDPDGKIAPGLVRRLVRWAVKGMEEAGFPVFSDVKVYTTDGNEPPAHRTYCVTFTNEKGGSIGIQGIMTNSGGWPFIDHGLFIDTR